MHSIYAPCDKLSLTEPRFGRMKRIQIYENGESRCYLFNIVPRNFRSWNAVLQHISNVIRPHFGYVKRLLELRTCKFVETFDELDPCEKYVALGLNSVLKIPIQGYRGCSNNMYRREKQLYCGRMDSEMICFLSETRKRGLTIIYVLRNGICVQEPRKVVFRKHDLDNWDLILRFLSQTLDIPEGVAFVCTIFGEMLCDPREFQHGYVYVAIPYQEDFVLLDYLKCFQHLCCLYRRSYAKQIKPCRKKYKKKKNPICRCALCPPEGGCKQEPPPSSKNVQQKPQMGDSAEDDRLYDDTNEDTQNGVPDVPENTGDENNDEVVDSSNKRRQMKDPSGYKATKEDYCPLLYRKSPRSRTTGPYVGSCRKQDDNAEGCCECLLGASKTGKERATKQKGESENSAPKSDTDVDDDDLHTDYAETTVSSTTPSKYKENPSQGGATYCPDSPCHPCNVQDLSSDFKGSTTSASSRTKRNRKTAAENAPTRKRKKKQKNAQDSEMCVKCECSCHKKSADNDDVASRRSKPNRRTTTKSVNATRKTPKKTKTSPPIANNNQQNRVSGVQQSAFKTDSERASSTESSLELKSYVTSELEGCFYKQMLGHYQSYAPCCSYQRKNPESFGTKPLSCKRSDDDVDGDDIAIGESVENYNDDEAVVGKSSNTKTESVSERNDKIAPGKFNKKISKISKIGEQSGKRATSTRVIKDNQCNCKALGMTSATEGAGGIIDKEVLGKSSHVSAKSNVSTIAAKKISVAAARKSRENTQAPNYEQKAMDQSTGANKISTKEGQGKRRYRKNKRNRPRTCICKPNFGDYVNVGKVKSCPDLATLRARANIRRRICNKGIMPVKTIPSGFLNDWTPKNRYCAVIPVSCRCLTPVSRCFWKCA